MFHQRFAQSPGHWADLNRDMAVPFATEFTLAFKIIPGLVSGVN